MPKNIVSHPITGPREHLFNGVRKSTTQVKNRIEGFGNHVSELEAMGARVLAALAAVGTFNVCVAILTFHAANLAKESALPYGRGKLNNRNQKWLEGVLLHESHFSRAGYGVHAVAIVLRNIALGVHLNGFGFFP